MSRSATRRYRVRFAVQGAAEISSGTLDFVLNVPDLAAIPVVAGSFVHPLDGATEMRPVTVRAVDYQGAVIAALAIDQRWTAIGRVVDIQWQDTADDPVTDAWTTYGTGRCSGLDELDGPGLFRIEISDETWVSRHGELFTEADTTQIWPAGMLYRWRGFSPASAGSGTRTGNTGSIYHITATGGSNGGAWPDWYDGDRGLVTSDIVSFCKSDLNPPALLDGAGNFKTLRCVYDGIEYEVYAFGGSIGSGSELSSLESAAAGGGNSFTVDIVWPGVPFVEPPASGDLYIYAPTHEPTNQLPLHVGVESASHYWGYPAASYASGGIPTVGGYLHPATLVRRFCEALQMRYNDTNLTAFEADYSYPLLAPYVLKSPTDPQKWLQEEVLGPNMLLFLRDSDGRMKLADLRPYGASRTLQPYLPPAQPGGTTLPSVMDVTNSKGHRWRLVGREAMNSVNWEWATYGLGSPAGIEPCPAPYLSAISTLPLIGASSFGGRILPEQGEVEAARLDFLVRRVDTAGPIEDPDTVGYIGRRERTFSWHSPMEPLDYSWWPTQHIYRIYAGPLTLSLRGAWYNGQAIGLFSRFLLDIFQDGPVRGTCEISGTLAETMEEGDYAIVDCGSVKIANPFTAARFGKVLVLVLSVTRYPAHAEIEYMLVGEALVFACPDPDDPTTWLLSPLNEAATTVLSFLMPEPLSPDLLTFYIQAAKNLAGGQTVNMDVALRYGGPAGLEVATWAVSDVSETATDYAFTLDASQQALITDWTLLFLEIGRSGDVGDTDPSVWRRLIVSGVWI